MSGKAGNMVKTQTVLTTAEARAFYDRFGRKQDSQGFYENPALDDLVASSRFREAQNAFEFGCGTGRFAARLLEKELPASATYLGCDLSAVMVALAEERLDAFAGRATVVQSDGAIRFPLSDRSVDRVVSCYLLDLLSGADIAAFLAGARRVLRPGGLLCLVSLTEGVSAWSRIVIALWMALFRLRPSLVGGCRPIRLEAYPDTETWQVLHRRVVAPFGVPSEVPVATVKRAPRD